MAIDRYALVCRHNPRLTEIDLDSPLTVGNGELCFTVDVTGLQSLYEEYRENDVPLCTLSQWGWHTTPVGDDRFAFSLDDVLMTEYDYGQRSVSYAVDEKPGNEQVYGWLRHNPHRQNLARIGFVYKGKRIRAEEISGVCQELSLYEGVVFSRFTIDDMLCEVETSCDGGHDSIGVRVQSHALNLGLEVMISFPYGSPDISASDWLEVDRHESRVLKMEHGRAVVERILDKDVYYVGVEGEGCMGIRRMDRHSIVLGNGLGDSVQREGMAESNVWNDRLDFSVSFGEVLLEQYPDVKQVFEGSRLCFKDFWEQGGAVELCRSKDRRAFELERRIVLSQFLTGIQCAGSLPPQETGLTCNSWYGKFHLEMHLWHCAYMPLWNRSYLLERSLHWYKDHLKQARENAARNGYLGARWPKMTSYDGLDSPSSIAVLLIWQQPHILYMLELAYRSNKRDEFLMDYWDVVRETGDFMADFAVYNEITGHYDLCSPIIPVQEEHDPVVVKNPAFEVEYWAYGLDIAVRWAGRLRLECNPLWSKVGENMAKMPVYDDLYQAHEFCHDTFRKFNRDHPSMVGAYGLISSKRVDPVFMKFTLDKVLQCWDYTTMWGWDFAMMAMTAVRLHDPDTAIDILLKDTPKNTYVASGNNYQMLRSDLPLYLPGNGSLLLAVAIMTAGYEGCSESLPGFPKNGMWEVEFENINRLF